MCDTVPAGLGLLSHLRGSTQKREKEFLYEHEKEKKPGKIDH